MTFFRHVSYIELLNVLINIHALLKEMAIRIYFFILLLFKQITFCEKAQSLLRVGIKLIFLQITN